MTEETEEGIEQNSVSKIKIKNSWRSLKEEKGMQTKQFKFIHQSKSIVQMTGEEMESRKKD